MENILKAKKLKKFKKIHNLIKLLLNFDDVDLNFIKNEKETEGTNIESDIIVEKKDNKNKNELIEKVNKRDISYYFKNDGKLIKAILI